MDRQVHDYAAAAASAMTFAQQQRPAATMQPLQPQFGFHSQHQHQQFPQPPFMPPHHSMQQFPYPHHMQQQQHSQLHPHPPPHPHLLQQQHRPPPYMPHLAPHVHPSPFHAPYDSPPLPAPPPSDPELQKRIDKLVEYAIKNGPEFEAMIREKQQDNPAYSFLFGGDDHNYYRYKLWLSTHPQGGPFSPPFPPSSMPMMHPPPNQMMNPAIGPSASLVGAPSMHQPSFPPLYDSQQNHLQHPQSFGAHGRLDFDQSSKSFRGLPGPLPSDVAVELNNVFNSLNGTKESIKGAKTWFMQRSPFVPALAEALRDRVFSVDDSERQLHIIYVVNDILFDSLQRRVNTSDLDNEALAFKSVLGLMLARVYHNPQSKDENQPRLKKILQFWASNKVYDQDTIYALEGEMIGGAMLTSFQGLPKELYAASVDSMASGFTQQSPGHIAPHSHWQPDKPSGPDQEHHDKQVPLAMPPSLGNQPFIPNVMPAFPGSMPINLSALPANQQQPVPHPMQAPPANVYEKLPPYPLFPPGLIPGMVKKMQIGSGVPYSPVSPLDIPSVIPTSNISPSEVRESVSKFLKEIGELNPFEG